MSVYKKGEKWFIDYYCDGRRVRESIGPNKSDAVAALNLNLVHLPSKEIAHET